MKYLIEEATLTGIADAVRGKKGTTDLIQVSNLATEISNIQGGGTVEELTITSNGTYNPPTGIDGFAPVVVNVPQDGAPPAEYLNFTGNISSMFSGSKWNWVLNCYGKQITMNNITNANGCFSENDIESIPIDSINFNTDSPDMASMFSNCYNLKEVPKITIQGASTPPRITYMFYNCYKLRELPYDYFTSMTDDWDILNSFINYDIEKKYLFGGCYSLRNHPDMTCLEQASTNNSIYYYTFYECYSLDEIVNYPVAQGLLVDNRFSSFSYSCNRIKNLTFRTNEDGTPIIARWKNQTINLGNDRVGYTSYKGDITGYNSGITADKEVKDDATYQALKNDPDWFSCDINYSRYNRTSAVNTINSLPDTSAYLATAGGTNTIKFNGASGSKTDGGAINTLTEEEIAVATAKGWTVSLI